MDKSFPASPEEREREPGRRRQDEDEKPKAQRPVPESPEPDIGEISAARSMCNFHVEINHEYWRVDPGVHTQRMCTSCYREVLKYPGGFSRRLLHLTSRESGSCDEEVKDALYPADRLLIQWELNTKLTSIPDYSSEIFPTHSLSLDDSSSVNILTHIARALAKEFSALHPKVHLIPNDRYLASVIWSALRQSTRDKITEIIIQRISSEAGKKLAKLVIAGEDPYWEASKVTFSRAEQLDLRGQ